MRLHDLAFIWPLFASAWAATAALGTGRRRPERRISWYSWSAACAIAAVASGLQMIVPASAANGPFGLYVGLAASACVLVGCGALALSALRAKG